MRQRNVAVLALALQAATWACSEEEGDGPKPYEPCSGLACGAPCKLCGPDDRGCSETLEPKECNEHGQCVDPTGVDCDGDVPCNEVAAENCGESGCYDIVGLPTTEDQNRQLRTVACRERETHCEAEPTCALAPDDVCWRFPNSCIPAQYERQDCGDPRCCAGDECVE